MSLVASGGHAGLGPGAGFARLATRPLPGGFLKEAGMCKKSLSGAQMCAANPLGKDPLS